MENFRKRQERRADESIARERERILSLFLPAVDNLTRALAHQNGAQLNEAEEGVRQGVELTLRELMRALAAEGVTQLETIGQSFDPAWHEAVATIPAEAQSGTVVEQVETGYKLGDKLLRPAKVVVAA
jgi:molecular chaperone GrpE